MLVEPEISKHRTIPFGIGAPRFWFPRSQWNWDSEYGCYVRLIGEHFGGFNRDDAYCMGDRLIYRSGSWWVGVTISEGSEKEFKDLVSALKWMLQAEYRDWGCLFWSQG